MKSSYYGMEFSTSMLHTYMYRTVTVKVSRFYHNVIVHTLMILHRECQVKHWKKHKQSCDVISVNQSS